MSAQKRVSKKEQALYEPILKALKSIFSCSGECYLEVTGKPRKFSDKLQEIFDDVTLYLINIEGFFPDITGFVKQHGSIKIITVEVKPDKPMIKDIFQAKNYAQIFNAGYARAFQQKIFPKIDEGFFQKERKLFRVIHTHP